MSDLEMLMKVLEKVEKGWYKQNHGNDILISVGFDEYAEFLFDKNGNLKSLN